MSLVKSYLRREILLPFFYALLVLVFILLLGQLFKIVNMVVSEGVRIWDVMHLVLAMIPQMLTMALPLAFFFAVLAGVGRLVGDGEVTALQAAGISPYQMLTPILQLAIACTMLTMLMSAWLAPWGIRQVRKVTFTILQDKVTLALRPQALNLTFPGMTIYLGDIDRKSGRLSSVFIEDHRKSEAHTLLWLLALGTTGHAIHKTFGNLFFLIAICGFLRIGAVGLEKIRRPRSQLFLLLLILTGLFFIYSQIFLNWSSSERFVALIYFPVLVFSGYGFNRLFFFWQKIRSGSGRISVLILFCLLLLTLSCCSILKKSHLSRAVVFKEIGQLLAARHPAGKEMNLCGTSGKIVFTHFYATIDSPGLVSLRKHCDITQVDKLKLSMLQSGQYDYLLLVDRDGGRQYFLRLIKEMPDSGITVVFEKNTEKYGRVTLFAL